MRGLPALLLTTALVAGACSGGDDAATTTSAPTDDDSAGGSGDEAPGGGSARFVSALVPFDDCDAFLAHVQAEARERVGPYGLDGDGGWIARPGGRLLVDEPAAEEPASDMADAPVGAPVPATPDNGDSGGGGDDGFTGTNVQEAGVDEPDIVKTDGERILTISDQTLSYVDIDDGGAPVVTDRLRLEEGWDHQMFFAGDRAFVITNGGDWARPMPLDDAIDGDAEARFADDDVAMPVEPGYWAPSALVMEIDLSDPSDLRITHSMRIEGRYLSARAIGDHVRLAISSSPDQLPWLYPQSAAGEERAREANRETVDMTTVEDWTPEYRVAGPEGTTTGPLVSCDRLHHPADFSGFDIVSVVDLDLSEGLRPPGEGADAVGVLAGGQTVYSSMDRFYIATTKWLPPSSGDDSVDDDRVAIWSEDFRTEVHAFAIAPGEPTTYVASGGVDGTLLNQFSLGEYEGDLRIVHTDGSPWNERDLSETHLTVLREEGDRLVQVGTVGGLGKGEQLYAARLLGDVGFAVTFRQVDPFYVLDLSDPTDPTVAGELKIPGFSTYLHPVGDDRVLGIGKDATEGGMVTGFKLSLFDVSEPAAPREISVWTMPNAESPVEYDHRAFQMWGSTAIVPIQNWGGGTSGAMLFDIGDEITEIGFVTHTGGGEPLSDCRVVTGDDLTPEGSDLWWMVQEGLVQVCDVDANGGRTGYWCETIGAGDMQWWFWDDETRERDLAAIGLDPDGRIEICWPDGYQEAIQRSLVVDGVLYTTSPSTIQANDLDSLEVLGQTSLR